MDAVGIARELGYGVTGNFVIDPDWGESDFERLWDFVARHDLGRAGFTILTPLPGTTYFDEMRLADPRGRNGPSTTCTTYCGNPASERSAFSSCTAKRGTARS